ncbi:hypothetical protein [Tenacibaculum aiptasiae]|uniref:hypothetical protein n=1 Tax=Tenacibaculum aiptasiae TaxID=426481 RepID=UPI00232B346A|nr:hypothetical protein [Tenacibaculum aiptasiae]
MIESQKGTDLYNKFKEQNDKTNVLWDEFKSVRNKDKVFVFKSMRFFIERFGLILCFFIYGFYNLNKTLRREKNNIGAVLFHTYIISVCIFYFLWIFQKFQDLNLASYILITITSASLITIGLYYMVKYKKDSITKLREQMFKISLIAIKNAKNEKIDVVAHNLKKIAEDK